MEKKALLISSYCASGFAYLGVRYGMYAQEGWPALTYNENLWQMLAWGIVHSIVAFCLITATLAAVICNTKSYQGKLIASILIEVFGTGVPSGLFVIKGLIIDPWYLPSLALFAGGTILAAILYISFLEAEKERKGMKDMKTKLVIAHLKLEHTKHLQFISSMCWIVIFSLLGYLSLFSPRITFELTIVPPQSLSRLFVIDITGVILFSIGLALGTIWQLIRRVDQIEDAILKIHTSENAFP